MESIKRFFYNLITDKNKSFYYRPLKFILWALSLVYWLALWARDAAYAVGIFRAKVLIGAKVISVGNITVGGTGKTPMTVKLATILRGKGKKVAVLTRGYGEDEYNMLKSYLGDMPVLKGKNRVRNGIKAIKNHKVDTLILDDGMQHKRLHKDINIIMMDTKNPFGNGYLLPRGILRYRLSRMKEADLCVFTKTPEDLSILSRLEERVRKNSVISNIFYTYHKPVSLYDIAGNREVPLDFLKNKEIAVLSGIADPEYFKRLLERLGAKISLEFSFMDHHSYKQREVDGILSVCDKRGLKIILTTDKDKVKLCKFFIDKPIKLFSLEIKIEFRKGENDFVNRLLGIYTR